jgi:HTH-type transcriptional regulator / antitoxin HigA
MSIFPIRSDEDHRRALDRIHGLMDAEEDTPEGAELEALATLVELYERKKYPPCPPTPLEAIIFRMEQMGYTQADLARLLKSRSRASELLRGSMKHLSLSMVRKLHDNWHIPADVLIRDIKPRAKAREHA